MRTIWIIIISAGISACDRGEDPSGAVDATGASGRSPAGQATERRGDSRPARASGGGEDHRSQELKDFLNSSAPQWLTLGAPIRPDVTDSPADPAMLQPGGLVPVGASEVLEVDGRTIKFPAPGSEITWIALSPSGNQVVVERGETAEVRRVDANGTVADSAKPLPALNFEADRRWMLTRWNWISDSELVAALNRPTADGDLIAESGMYYFNLDTQNLREIDLPVRLINPADPYVEVLGSAGRQVHLRTLSAEAWLGIPAAP